MLGLYIRVAIVYVCTPCHILTIRIYARYMYAIICTYILYVCMTYVCMHQWIYCVSWHTEVSSFKFQVSYVSAYTCWSYEDLKVSYHHIVPSFFDDMPSLQRSWSHPTNRIMTHVSSRRCWASASDCYQASWKMWQVCEGCESHPRRTISRHTSHR